MKKVILSKQIVKRLAAVVLGLSLIIGTVYTPTPGSGAVAVKAATSTEQAVTGLNQDSKLKKGVTGVLTALGKTVVDKSGNKNRK